MTIDLDELERLAAAATDGPWTVEQNYDLTHGCRCGSCWEPVCGEWLVKANDDMTAEKDAAFIAASRTAVPELIAEVRRLRAKDRDPLSNAMLREYCMDYAQKNNALTARVAQLEGALRAVEWTGGQQAGIGDGTDPCCPYCCVWAEKGAVHAPDCIVGAALGGGT